MKSCYLHYKLCELLVPFAKRPYLCIQIDKELNPQRKMLKLYQKLIAGCLVTLGFAACTSEEPDLYGPIPTPYEPTPADTTQVHNTTTNANE